MMKNYRLVLIGFMVILGWAIFFCCGDAEHTNPYDPENPDNELKSTCRGYVVSAISRHGIANAIVKVFSATDEYVDTTDEEGYYQLYIPDGTYSVFVERFVNSVNFWADTQENVGVPEDEIVDMDTIAVTRWKSHRFEDVNVGSTPSGWSFWGDWSVERDSTAPSIPHVLAAVNDTGDTSRATAILPGDINNFTMTVMMKNERRFMSPLVPDYSIYICFRWSTLFKLGYCLTIKSNRAALNRITAFGGNDEVESMNIVFERKEWHCVEILCVHNHLNFAIDGEWLPLDVMDTEFISGRVVLGVEEGDYTSFDSIDIWY